MLHLSGVSGGGTWGQNSAEQERPYLAAKSGKDRGYHREISDASYTKKIIVKPCAGERHAQFERGN